MIFNESLPGSLCVCVSVFQAQGIQKQSAGSTELLQLMAASICCWSLRICFPWKKIEQQENLKTQAYSGQLLLLLAQSLLCLYKLNLMNSSPG